MASAQLFCRASSVTYAILTQDLPARPEIHTQNASQAAEFSTRNDAPAEATRNRADCRRQSSQGNQVRSNLAPENEAVKRRYDQGTRCQEPQQRPRNNEAQELVRQELEPDRIAPGRHRSGNSHEKLVIAAQGAHLAAEFVAGLLGQAVVCDRPLVVNTAEALHDDGKRPVDVVQNGAGRDRAEQLPPHRADGPRDANRGVYATFRSTQPFFIAPVQSHAGHDAGRFLQDQFAADRANARVGKILQKSLQGVGSPALAGVGKDDDLMLRGTASLAEGHGLAPIARELDDPQFRAIRRGLGDFPGTIGGSVRHENDLALESRGLDLVEQLAHATGDYGRFVMRRQHYAHGGRARCSTRRPAPQMRYGSDQQRVDHVGINYTARTDRGEATDVDH